MPKFMGIHTLPPGGFTAEQVRNWPRSSAGPRGQGLPSFCSLAGRSDPAPIGSMNRPCGTGRVRHTGPAA